MQFPYLVYVRKNVSKCIRKFVNLFYFNILYILSCKMKVFPCASSNEELRKGGINYPNIMTAALYEC